MVQQIMYTRNKHLNNANNNNEKLKQTRKKEVWQRKK